LNLYKFLEVIVLSLKESCLKKKANQFNPDWCIKNLELTIRNPIVPEFADSLGCFQEFTVGEVLNQKLEKI
jgi:hypothetical protein